MSVPPHPPSGGPYAPEVVWGPPPAPSWGPAWPPAGGPPPPVPPGPRRAVDRPLVMVLVALASLLVGAVAAGVVALLVFLAGAAEIGRGFGEEFSQVAELPPLEDEGVYGPVDQFPAAAPGALGEDPALDAQAADCFGGDLVACDDLYFDAPPMSDYEEYALTCGGRVKAWVVVSCTELE